jgi:glutamate/tyrosine decarboxylase-like PLP-dependent enzyme
VAEFRRAVERGIENAERAEKLLRRAGVWRIVTPARMGVVTFTWSPPGIPAVEAREVTQGLVEAALEDGTTLVSSTTLGGEPVLRICAINPRTTTADLETSVERLAELAGRAPRA